MRTTNNFSWLMIRLTFVLFSAFMVSSCDPGHAVILNNQSQKIRNIKVIVTDKWKFDRLNSIAITDSPKRVLIPIIKDSNELSYSFTLENGKNAVLQQGIGKPDMSEKIIIDGCDTISLKKDKRVQIKKQGIMSTLVTVKIE